MEVVGAEMTASSAGEAVLRHFWDMASIDEGIRLNAAVSLVEELAGPQAEHESTQGEAAAAPPPPDTASKQAKSEYLLRSCCPLLLYSLKRLVRGLGSGRQAARQGFALALTLLLTKIESLSSEGVMALLDLYLQASASMKGSDAKDFLLGRAFGYSAVIRSGRARGEAPLARQLATALLSLLQSKSFLREVSAAALLELLEQMDDSALAGLFEEVQGLPAFVQSPAESATPEALFMALRLWGRLPAQLLGSCALLPQGATPPPAGFFADSKPQASNHPAKAADAFFSPKHLASVLGPLRASTASHPRLHSVWLTLLALLIPGFTPAKVESAEASEKGTPGPGQLEAFWSVVVEGDLFLSSHERKFLGFQLFTLLLPFLGPDQVPAVFSPKFQQTLVNSLSQQDRILHPAAKKAVNRLTAFAEKAATPALRVSIAVALQRQGGGGFDRLTRTKTVGHLLQSMDADSIQLYVKHLKSVFAAGDSSLAEAAGKGGGDEEAAVAALDGSRGWVLEQLAGAANLQSVSPATQQSVAHFLATLAFFELDASQVKSKELKSIARLQPPLTEVTRKLCASRLVTLLERAGKVARRAADPPKPSKIKQEAGRKLPGPPKPAGEAGPDSQEPKALAAEGPKTDANVQHERRGENTLLRDAVEYAATLQGTKGVRLAVELSEPIQAAVTTLRKLEKQAAEALMGLRDGEEGGGGKGSRADQVLAFLHLACWLQLYVVGDAENAEVELAEELAGVYSTAFGKGSKAKRDSGAEGWMDRLVDVLLSLLAYSSAELPSAPLREATEAMFRAFAAHLTQTGLRDMVRIVSRPERAPREGEEDVLASEEDEGDSDEDGDEDEDEPSSSDEEAVEEAAGGGKADGAVDMEIDDAGGPSALEQDSDEELPDMSDEQMFKMDKLLAAVLRTQKDAKDRSKNTKQAMQNFKLRTLALLEAYSQALPGSGLIAGVLPDLVRAADAAGKPGAPKVLAERLRAVVAKLCRNRPDATTAKAILPSDLTDWACAIHLTAARGGAANLALRGTSETAIHYLIGTAVTAGTEEHLEAAAAICKRIMSSMFRKHLRVPLTLVQELIRKHPALCGTFLPEVAGYVGSARTAFLQSQAASLLPVILHLPQDKMGAVTKAARSSLPILAASSASLVRGETFAAAGKHAEAVKQLAASWEALKKLLGGDLGDTLGPADKQGVLEACEATHKTAASPKIAVAVVRICKAVTDTQLEQFDPEGPKREYQSKTSETEPGGKGGIRAAQKIQPPSQLKPAEPADKPSKQSNKKRKSGELKAVMNGVVKATEKANGKGDKKKSKQKQPAAVRQEEPQILIVDELLEGSLSKKKKKKSKKTKDQVV